MATGSPQTAATGQHDIPLDGDWAFAVEQSTTGSTGWERPDFDDSGWDIMSVPGNWDLHDPYANHHGPAWYRRRVTTLAREPGQVVRLHFEAVYYHAQVWFNGTLLGEHSGGYTPFEWDVTALLNADGTANTVAVRADSSYSIGAWWSWGGISRSVTLVVNDPVRVERQHIIATPDLDAGTAHLDAWVTVSNAGATAAEVTVRGELPGQRVVSAPLTVPAGGDAEAHLQLDLPAGSFDLWRLDAPALYPFTTTVLDTKGSVRHVRADRFGIRKVEVRGTGLYLNGEQVRLSGYNRVGDDRVAGATEPEYLVRRDIDRMKAAGATMMRIHHVPQAPILLDYADEKGLLLIEEIPTWGAGANLDPGDEVTRGQLRDMIRRDYNHPSIIAWSVCNEIQGTTEAGRTYVRTMFDYIRTQLDSTRLLTYISNSYPGAKTGADDALQYTDFACINMYSSFAANADHAHALYPDKPIFVSEFSSDGVSLARELPDAATSSATTAQTTFPARPWLIGESLWSYNDYRSDYPGSSADQVRGWGVQTVWGQLKRAYGQMQAAYAPVAGLSVATSADGGRRVSLVRLVPRGPLDSDGPSHVLRGYRLAWQVTDAAGQVLDGRLIDLADLHPGGEARATAVRWNDSGRAVAARVSLLSPVGYEVTVADEALRPPGRTRITEVLACDGGVRVVAAPVPGAVSYQLLATAGGHTLRSPTTVDPTQIDLTGLTNGTAYDLTVVTTNGAGGTTSDPVSATPTAGAGTIPPVIQDVVPVDGGLVLGFVVAAGATSYQVRVLDATGSAVRDYTTTLVGSTRVEGLPEAGMYRVRIRGLAAGGAALTAWSQPVEARLAAPPQLRVYGGLGGGDSLALRITPDPRAQRHQVTIDGPGGGTHTIESAAVDLLTVGGLRAGHAYHATVRTQSPTGWSAAVTLRVATAAADRTPAPTAAPAALTSTEDAGTGSGGDVTLTWSAVPGTAGYLVSRLDGAGRVDAAVTAGTSVRLGAEGDVASNVYVVAAFTAGGLGPDSAAYTVPGTPAPRTVVVTPLDTAPDATGVTPYTETGTWLASSLPGVDGEPTRYSSQVGAAATWSPRLTAAGDYLVEIWVPPYSSSSRGVRYDVAHDGGTDTLTVDQIAVGGAWYALGAWSFPAGHGGTVTLTFIGGSGFARADAVRFTPAR